MLLSDVRKKYPTESMTLVNVSLKGEFRIFIDIFSKGPTKTAPQEKNRGTTEKGLS